VYDARHPSQRERGLYSATLFRWSYSTPVVAISESKPRFKILLVQTCFGPCTENINQAIKTHTKSNVKSNGDQP
jgi:hypothetical protein